MIILYNVIMPKFYIINILYTVENAILFIKVDVPFTINTFANSAYCTTVLTN